MKFIKIIVQIAMLYGFYFLGEQFQHVLNLPIPGSIVGLLVLFGALLVKAIPVTWIEEGAGTLLHYLTLLFVPATVGVINYLYFFSGKNIGLVLIVMVSTLITMLASGTVSQIFANKTGMQRERSS
ncbi:CidA/LrgA family protein [Thalassobacillus sp. CUG 92003]|uniref:CidA/LrgA family protein n=1 Tax=Thalassobacillus sp. CUG 92003 TaxID=2736641 RepID=UPI0015E6D687|nr:CidA/LrgA family protein [Thalassobacillus sp. CUG 92003]